VDRTAVPRRLIYQVTPIYAQVAIVFFMLTIVALLDSGKECSMHFQVRETRHEYSLDPHTFRSHCFSPLFPSLGHVGLLDVKDVMHATGTSTKTVLFLCGVFRITHL